HEIGHEVKDAVVLAGCLAEEMRRVAEIGLDAENAASAPEREAKIGALLLTVRKTRTVRRVAAEIEPHIRRHETISAGRRRRRHHDQTRHRADVNDPHDTPLPLSQTAPSKYDAARGRSACSARIGPRENWRDR